MKNKINLAMVAMGLILLSSCAREKNHPGYNYYPDMTYSQAYETYAENPVYPDSAVMKGPVRGSVSREMQPYQFLKGNEGRQSAGNFYFNPLSVNDSLIETGRRLFILICAQCHGELGDGKGFLFTEKLYPYPPANLLLDKTLKAPDGELYHVASVGFNLMGAHGSMLKPEERWTVIAYIRKLQLN